MKVEGLNESQSTTVLVVDVQPTYDKGARTIVGPLCDFLNRTSGRIVALFNGDQFTEDLQSDVANYLAENGLDPFILGDVEFLEKGYAFFRNWMDSDVPDRIIIKVIRAMVMQDKPDSRMLDMATVLTEAEIEELDSHSHYWREDMIYLPDFMTVKQLRGLSPFYMVGGGRNECLREIELICNAFNIRYRRIDKFVY